jgi:hypothetical protein
MADATSKSEFDAAYNLFLRGEYEGESLRFSNAERFGKMLAMRGNKG